MSMPVVTRFAPSPTGFMHIGSARTALFSYLFAKKEQGTFILRIEDTDQEREVPGSVEHIQESLRWLGIEWDYGPDKPGPFGSCIQSKRLDSYREFAKKLIEKGFAYPDPYTTEELESFRARAAEEKRPFLFRDHRPETFGAWDGRKPLRFRVPELKRWKWEDAVRGDLEAGEEALDDFILMKSDGFPTYNFAHIVDDHLMGVTHVFRSDEFISSTPRFLSLYEALGIERPVFVTLPPILREDRTKKLGKRDGAKDLLEYRREGYLPEALVNYLALIGWNPGTEEEVFSKAGLIERFSIEQIQKSGGAFDEQKLRWFNREHLLALAPEAFLAEAKGFVSEKTWKALSRSNLLAPLVPLMRERAQTFADLRTMDEAGEFDLYTGAPAYEREKFRWKDEPSYKKTADRLRRVEALLELIPAGDWHDAKIKETVWPYADTEGRGAVLWPLRYALSGRERSPDPFVIAGLIGKDETLRRISTALETLA